MCIGRYDICYVTLSTLLLSVMVRNDELDLSTLGELLFWLREWTIMHDFQQSREYPIN